MCWHCVRRSFIGRGDKEYGVASEMKLEPKECWAQNGIFLFLRDRCIKSVKEGRKCPLD